MFIFSVAFSDKRWPSDINIKRSNKIDTHAHTHACRLIIPTCIQTQDINIIYEHLYAEYILLTNIMRAPADDGNLCRTRRRRILFFPKK